MHNSNNIKTEVAIEMISMYIGLQQSNNREIAKKLIREREEIYLGNEFLVEKVISEYGNKIKKLLN